MVLVSEAFVRLLRRPAEQSLYPKPGEHFGRFPKESSDGQRFVPLGVGVGDYFEDGAATWARKLPVGVGRFACGWQTWLGHLSRRVAAGTGASESEYSDCAF